MGLPLKLLSLWGLWLDSILLLPGLHPLLLRIATTPLSSRSRSKEGERPERRLRGPFRLAHPSSWLVLGVCLVLAFQVRAGCGEPFERGSGLELPLRVESIPQTGQSSWTCALDSTWCSGQDCLQHQGLSLPATAIGGVWDNCLVPAACRTPSLRG